MPDATRVIVEADAVAPNNHPLVRWVAPSRHGAACSCCRPRAALAEVLLRIFLARVRGVVPWFEYVELNLVQDRKTIGVFAAP